jgi:hypothetical protein
VYSKLTFTFKLSLTTFAQMATFPYSPYSGFIAKVGEDVVAITSPREINFCFGGKRSVKRNIGTGFLASQEQPNQKRHAKEGDSTPGAANSKPVATDDLGKDVLPQHTLPAKSNNEIQLSAEDVKLALDTHSSVGNLSTLNEHKDVTPESDSPVSASAASVDPIKPEDTVPLVTPPPQPPTLPEVPPNETAATASTPPETVASPAAAPPAPVEEKASERSKLVGKMLQASVKDMQYVPAQFSYLVGKTRAESRPCSKQKVTVSGKSTWEVAPVQETSFLAYLNSYWSKHPSVDKPPRYQNEDELLKHITVKDLESGLTMTAFELEEGRSL